MFRSVDLANRPVLFRNNRANELFALLSARAQSVWLAKNLVFFPKYWIDQFVFGHPLQRLFSQIPLLDWDTFLTLIR